MQSDISAKVYYILLFITQTKMRRLHEGGCKASLSSKRVRREGAMFTHENKPIFWNRTCNGRGGHVDAFRTWRD
jgi:hypothetical protein